MQSVGMKEAVSACCPWNFHCAAYCCIKGRRSYDLRASLLRAASACAQRGVGNTFSAVMSQRDMFTGIFVSIFWQTYARAPSVIDAIILFVIEFCTGIHKPLHSMRQGTHQPKRYI